MMMMMMMKDPDPDEVDYEKKNMWTINQIFFYTT